jgi:hypothetical protein
MTSLDHVRRSDLPWRTATLTECGRPVEGLSTISRAEFAARVKQQGQQRSALTTCMTCWDTARRWPEWVADPVAAMAREVAGAGHYSDGRHDQIRDELRALAALVEEYRTEFDEFLAGLAKTVSLAEHRAQRRQRMLGGGRATT